MESPKPEKLDHLRELSTEEVQDAQIGLLEWELEERDKLTGIDHLTGAKMLRAFEHELGVALQVVRGDTKEKRKGAETYKEISLIAIDIDHFKSVNDTLGHPAGDDVLRKVAAAVMQTVRESDTVARVGGEEMMVLMRGADKATAAAKAEKLRKAIEQLTFEAYPGLKVTASFGVITSGNSTDPSVLRKRVDQALYAAKHGGRNRVEMYNGDA